MITPEGIAGNSARDEHRGLQAVVISRSGLPVGKGEERDHLIPHSLVPEHWGVMQRVIEWGALLMWLPAEANNAKRDMVAPVIYHGYWQPGVKR